MNVKGLLLFALMILPTSGLLCCSGEEEERKEILARINDFELTLTEFELQLAAELEFDAEFRVTNEAKETFLRELIRKELLIQEAKGKGLDRKEKFISSMERYWEATLIRDLMELKGAEIDGRTYVSAEEVQDSYRAMAKAEETVPPLHVIETELIAELKQKKKSERLEEWMRDLERKARIEVHEDVLYRD
jgi:hypothetical protein